jgi:pilus assembly protein Flp/PilA
MKSMILAFLRDEEGLTTVEYAIAGGLVGAGVIAAFDTLGTEIAEVIDQIWAALDAIVI